MAVRTGGSGTGLDVTGSGRSAAGGSAGGVGIWGADCIAMDGGVGIFGPGCA